MFSQTGVVIDHAIATLMSSVKLGVVIDHAIATLMSSMRPLIEWVYRLELRWAMRLRVETRCYYLICY
jgi:hypothetical protein